MAYAPNKQNGFGLTWDEWAKEAHIMPTAGGGYDTGRYPSEYRAWQDGEDPRDWRFDRD